MFETKLPLSKVRSPEMLQVALEAEEGKLINIVFAASLKGLSRYNIHPGKKYGHAPGKPRFEIKDFLRNQVIYKDLSTGKVFNKDIDELLDEWSSKQIYEISPVDEVLDTINKYVSPLIGAGLAAALIAWLMGKMK